MRQLRDRLEDLDAEALRDALLTHAATLQPAARGAFLELFEIGRRAATAAGHESLLADIADFVERVRGGDYFDGWGWDDDLRDERSWGDESWAEEMDSLFVGAAHAFVAGDLTLALDAYRGLLDAFLLDEEVGTFCGTSPATEMVTTDLTEAKARAVRATYEITPPDQRVDAVAIAMSKWRYIGDVVGLGAVADARIGALPGIDRFLDDWIARLRPRPGGSLAADDRALLVEAAAWREGAAGVGVLAHDHGPDVPELFVDWVDALSTAGRPSDAAAACRYALGAMPSHGEARAQIAEHLAALATQPADRVFCAREAWRAAPTTPRLRRLVTTADRATIDEEVNELDKTRAPARLAAGLLVLAGRVDDAAALLRPADPLGWGGHDHPGPLVLPILLMAAVSARETQPSLPGATSLLTAVDLAGWHDLHHLVEDAYDGRGPIDEDEPRELSALLIECIHLLPTTPEQRARWLALARAVADARVDAIVQAKHRGAYDRAAHVAVATAEAVALAEGTPVAAAAITTLRDRYPRHVAFRAALDAATTRSPLLPPPPRRRR